MTRHRTAVAFVVSALALIALSPVQSAYANHVPCNSIITTNTVLDSDVGPCVSGGLRIEASGITLDLNGHSVLGTAQPGDGTGIHLLRVSNVTVKNGSVRNFDMGVAIEGGSGNTVRSITARDNIGTNSTNGGDGIAILSSQNNRIIGNITENNGALSGIGVYSTVDMAHPRATTGVSSGNLIQGNQVLNNIASRFGDVTTTDNIGIRVEPNSPGNFIIANQVIGNGLDGITLFVGANNNVIRGNSVHRNGLYRTTARRGNGIGLQSLPGQQGASGNLIENNVVTENGDNGIVLRGPRGGAPGAINNVVRNNTAVRNAILPLLGPAFGPAYDLNDNNPNCDNNLWRGNRYLTAEPPCTRL
ncbi:MAG: right-handed parallel beta-helix repeat-containing protein [Actinomycetota bacterium]|nr:right-handed parallel beta-helix repeat-containing protein [Actinomycetota bacterium]